MSSSAASASTTASSSYDSSSSSLPSSLFDPTYTYSYDKYSCIRGFYFAHLVFVYIVFISGFGCLVTRLFQKAVWVHSWLGRIYILGMLWSTGTSMLIHNTGLPLATLISFAAIGVGVTVGWFAIILHQQQVARQAQRIVQRQLTERLLRQQTTSQEHQQQAEEGETGGVKKKQQQQEEDGVGTTGMIDLDGMLSDAKVQAVSETPWTRRVLSYKTVHAVLFFMTWFQISGRIFASNQSGDFTCYTYPVYKPIDTPEGDYAPVPTTTSTTTTTANASSDVDDGVTLVLVPEHDPDYDRLPWANGVYGWSFAIIFGSMAAAFVVKAAYDYFAVRGGVLVAAAAAASASAAAADASTPPKGRTLADPDNPNEQQQQQ